MKLPSRFRATMIRVIQRQPRLCLALVFGIVGIAVATLWWSPVIFHAQRMNLFGLFIVLPGLCAAIVASLIGKPLLDGVPAQSILRPAARGAAIGSLALVLFAPLFSVFYVLTEPATEHWNVFGLAVLVLLGALVAALWLVALAGAVVGWAVYRLALSVITADSA
jgi:hypothetical protein